MREYMMNLGSVLMLIALSNMIIPEGGVKKYASLAMGFMLISSAVSIIPVKVEDISFSTAEKAISQSQIFDLKEQFQADIMKKHRENLENIIEEKMKYGSKAYVKITEDGEIESVEIFARGDESAAVFYIVDSLKVPRERIKLSYDKN